MAAKKKLTDEQLADEFTAMAVAHLDKLPAAERKMRLREFGKRVASGCAAVSKRQLGSTQ